MKLKKRCVICGKDFEVEIRDSDRKILTDCFYSPELLKDVSDTEYWECSICCNDDSDKIREVKIDGSV